MIFSLAPINPNVNGIYYEKNSYKKSIKRYLKSKSENILYSNYTNATQSHNARSAEPIGIIKNIDLENRQIDIELFSCFSFIKSDEYVIGFSMTANENVNSSGEYFIEKINYCCLIPKEEILTSDITETI